MNCSVPRDEPNTSDPRRRGAIAIVLRETRLLAIRRSETVIAPGAICFPGGGIEGAEDETTALRRELREELNVEVEPVRRLWRSVTPWQVELAWWLANLAHDAVLEPNPAEVESFGWYTLDELTALPDLLPSNRPFLAAIASGKISLV